jgi:hypothetical protein
LVRLSRSIEAMDWLVSKVSYYCMNILGSFTF